MVLSLIVLNNVTMAGCGHLGCLPHYCLSGNDGPAGFPMYSTTNAAADLFSVSLKAATHDRPTTFPRHVDTDEPEDEPEVLEDSRVATDTAPHFAPMPRIAHLVNGASTPLYLTHQSLLC